MHCIPKSTQPTQSVASANQPTKTSNFVDVSGTSLCPLEKNQRNAVFFLQKILNGTEGSGKVGELKNPQSHALRAYCEI